MVQFKALQKLPATQIFFPLFLMLSIHEAHYSVLLLYGFFLSVFLLWAATALLSPPASTEGLCCSLGKRCRQWERKLAQEVSAGGLEV